jgi:hypothetical protein
LSVSEEYVDDKDRILILQSFLPVRASVILIASRPEPKGFHFSLSLKGWRSNDYTLYSHNNNNDNDAAGEKVQ